MNILVTGGAGFIGSNFIRRRILDKNCKIDRLVNIDLLTYAGNLSNLDECQNESRYIFVRGDIGDADLVANILSRFEISAVVNFAAESHVDRSIESQEVFFNTNIVGTLRLLNCVKNHWLNLSGLPKNNFRFLHVSTDEVYGTLGSEEAPWDENAPYKPNSPYAASKAGSDHIVRSFHQTYQLPTIITHCSNNYGPYHHPEKLIPLMIVNALGGKSLPIYGDGKQVRDWLYVDDHVDAIWLSLTRGRVGNTYNVGGGNERINLEIVNHICSLLDKKSPRADGKSYTSQIVHVADRLGHDRRYAIDSSKIRNELGWSPKESFDTGLEKTVDWYLRNREWISGVISKTWKHKNLERHEIIDS
jgi:dTDP-glucose 4,6-dehydratase